MKFRLDGMTIAEYAQTDMQWYEEVRTAVQSFRQGQQARAKAEEARRNL